MDSCISSMDFSYNLVANQRYTSEGKAYRISMEKAGHMPITWNKLFMEIVTYDSTMASL